MRISDWSSDVCSSDLDHIVGAVVAHAAQRVGHARRREDVADVREIAVRLIEIAPLGEIGDELLAKDVHAIFEGRHLVPRLGPAHCVGAKVGRSEEHTSELQSLMRISYAVFCLKKKTKKITHTH